MNPFAKLVGVMLVGAILGCGSAEVVERPRAAEPDVTLRPVAADEDTATEIVFPPAPNPRLEAEQLDWLVRESPCDILPEYGQRVGTLAHPHGYPRWHIEERELAYDSASELAMTPDPSVVHALRGALTYENEVHDCQRLVVMENDAPAFGPLVGIFPIDAAVRMPDHRFGRPRQVATVYNWGGFNREPEPYGPLGIRPGWNCLWLERDSEDRWRAAITNAVAGPCILHDPPHEFPLDVERLHHETRPPRTARFGWEERSAVQLLGLKCGSAWCWVGPPEQWQHDRRQLTGDAHITVPGWFDEQHLDVPNQSGGDPVVPGPIAVVTPSLRFHAKARDQRAFPFLDLTTDFFRGRPVVARIDIPGQRRVPPTYAEKWGSEYVPVELRMEVPSTGNDPWERARSTFLKPDGTDGRTVAPTRTSNVHHGAHGALRWRWHDSRSTMSLWSACGVKGKDCCDTN